MAKKATDTFEYSTDATMLDAYISKIASRAKTLTEDIHTTLVGALMHCVEHGNPVYIQRLDDALNDGFWKRGFRTFVVELGPVDWVKQEGKPGKDGYKPAHWSLNKDKRKAIQAKLDTHLATLIGTPYWKYADQKSDEFEGFNIPELLRRLVARAERVAKDEAKANHEKNNWHGLAELKALANSLTKKSAPAPTSAPLQEQPALTSVH
jgi:hypothetical protein